MEVERSGIYEIFTEIVRLRNVPSEQDLLQTEDKILTAISKNFAVTVHELSVTLKFFMFRIEFLAERLKMDELVKLLDFVFFGKSSA